MANLISKALRSSWPNITMDDYVQMFQYGGMNYPFMRQTMTGNVESIDQSYESFIQSAYKSNGVVFAVMLARQFPFAEARFTFRERRNGRPGNYFGNKSLELLEHPWKNATTADLLTRAIQDVDLAGNFFITKRNATTLKRMRPDWVTIIMGSPNDADADGSDLDAEVIGYAYHPGGRQSGKDPVLLLPEFVSHWAPIPDPQAAYRGMSWLVPVIREFMSDTAMVVHKQKFFENGATPNLVVTLEPGIKKDAFKEWVEMFKNQYSGVTNAYKTLYLGAGAQVMPVGKDFRQMDFALTQAAGETRIAAAGGVPPVIVGLSEGLQSATYSNYAQARRRLADMTLRPNWRGLSGALEIMVPPPPASELWYDDRDIPFLDEDIKDRAEVQAKDTSAIRQLIDAGFDPDSVVEAVTAKDLTRLQGKHSGLYSVQLQPPYPNGITPAPTTPPQLPAGKKAKPKAKVSKPKPAIEAKSEREAALEMFNRALDAVEASREVSSQPTSIEVHTHLDEGAVQIDAPITVDAPTTFADGAMRFEPSIEVDARTEVAEGAVRVDAPVTIAEGAIRGGDVTVEPGEFILRDGAIHIETPVTIEEGAVRVEAPITVEGHELELRDGAIHVVTNIEEGAVKVDAPVTVNPAELRMEAGAIHVPVTVERTEVPVTIAEGAVKIDSPITVERTEVEVHVDEGAVRLDAPITVNTPDVEVRVEPGAVQVPVTVERTEVTIAEGAVKVDAPVTVERTEVHIDEGAVNVPVTVERTEVHIDEGAVRVDSPVTIEEGAVRMDAPITVERTEVHVAPPELRMEEGAIQVPVTIAEGAVQVDAPVTLDRGAVEVTVESPVTIERGAVDVQVEAPEVPPVDTSSITEAIDELRGEVDKLNKPKRIVRDENHRIVGLETAADSEETEDS